MLKAWLTEALQKWFVPKEDYDLIRSRHWSLEEKSRWMQQEINELVEAQYSSYRPMDQYAASSRMSEEIMAVTETMFERKRYIAAVEFDPFSIMSLVDPTTQHKLIRQMAVTRLTEHFESDLRRKIKLT